MEFLSEFERNLGFQEDVENFRQDNSYNNFVGRWSLAVYYQIRFREIALPIEISMDVDEFLNLSEKSSNIDNEQGSILNKSRFRLKSTNAVISALEKCWSPSIFLSAILHRFWKLNLQIIARHSMGIANVVTAICKEADAKPEKEMKHSHTPTSLAVDDTVSISSARTDMSNNSVVATQKGHSRSASDQNINADNVLIANEESNKVRRQKQKEKLVLMFLDITDLSKYIRTTFFDDTVLPMVTDLDDEMKQNLKISLVEGCNSVLQHLQIVSSSIVQNISSKCLLHLNSVHDIQRLYRRTNRQVPSKPCPYITSVMLPIQQFFTETSTICPKDVLHNWSIDILSTVANEYLSVVSETLAAVQKMEESLKRLKKVRERTTGNAGDKAQEVVGVAKISDDDKIRLQLYVDVKHFISQIEKGMSIESREIKSILVLENLVIEATKACFDDYIAKIGESGS